MIKYQQAHKEGCFKVHNLSNHNKRVVNILYKSAMEKCVKVFP